MQYHRAVIRIQVRIGFGMFQPKEVKFEFPNLLPEERKKEQSDQMKEIERVRDTYRKDQERFKDRPGVPTWFN